MLKMEEMEKEDILKTLEELNYEVALMQHKIDAIKGILNSDIVKENTINPKDIILMVSEFCGVPYSSIVGKSRIHETVEARFIAMYLIRHHCGYGYEAVGKVFKKCHGTVMNAVSQVNNLVDIDKRFRKKLNEVIKLFDERFENET